MKNKTFLTRNDKTKTFCIVSESVANSMIGCGNPYGHNRACEVLNLSKCIASLTKAGYAKI